MAFSPTIDGPVDTAYRTALERRGDSTHVLKMSLRKFFENIGTLCRRSQYMVLAKSDLTSLSV